jgi:adenine/guanine phosphoribosyltransferase-like PRPP-binding protein
VALIDDVVSTGGSCAAALRLLRAVGAEPVAVGAIVSEGDAWKGTLGDDSSLVRVLGELPLFRPVGDGSYVIAGAD